MSYSPLTEQLIQSLRSLPGVGVRSAQKMALHLLERDRFGAERLSESLSAALEGVGHCQKCRMLTEDDLCNICSDNSRDRTKLCVVESPSDQAAIEMSGAYFGYYFVLMGQLSPINGVGPEDIGVPELVERLKSGDVRELILATNSTVEGEATAHYIAVEARNFEKVQLSRIAHGIPAGGMLEQVDSQTLQQAMDRRSDI